MRRHRQQMTPQETTRIESVVRSLPVNEICEHARSRMWEKGITVPQAVAALNLGSAIEIHNDAGELRVLLRYFFEQSSVCVVLSLDRRCVVTAWRNDGCDFHRTLDLRAYTWRVNAVQLLVKFA